MFWIWLTSASKPSVVLYEIITPFRIYTSLPEFWCCMLVAYFYLYLGRLDSIRFSLEKQRKSHVDFLSPNFFFKLLSHKDLHAMGLLSLWRINLLIQWSVNSFYVSSSCNAYIYGHLLIDYNLQNSAVPFPCVVKPNKNACSHTRRHWIYDG